MSNLKCLLLGGTGFLGINLCKYLYANGYDVTIYNHCSVRFKRFKQLFPHVQIIDREFSSETKESLIDILGNIDVVFHLISTTNPSNKNVLYDFESNVLPTIRLLDACVKAKVKKIIYFSSGGTVYGIPRYIPIDEGHRTEPLSAYGIHKLAVEKCLEYYGRTYQLNYNILRVSNPYGEGQNPFSNQGVVAVFLAKALMHQPIEIWGDGSVMRDYIFVDDVIIACIKILNYQGKNSVFNVGSGVGYSLQEIIRIIQKTTGSILDINYLAGRVQDVPANILDISLMKKEVKWSPEITINEGIKKMLSSWNYAKKEFEVRV